MHALIVDNHKLRIEKVEAPKPKTQEVLISVKALGINHADLLQREGKYPPPPGTSPILGLEVAGVVEELGSHTTRFKVGDRVMALLAGGGYAQKVSAPESHLMPIPPNLSFEEAAAIPEVFLTAYQALFLIGELQPKQWVLIHAAGSGVGTAALQLARSASAHSIATTRSQDKLERCLTLGAEAVINPTKGGFVNKVDEITQGHGADLILDFVGAPYFLENIEATAPGGAIISLATLGGSVVEKLDLHLLLKKWITFSATTLRSRPPEYKAHLIEEFSHFALKRFETGELKAILHQTYPWSEVEKAHETLKRNSAFGKLVLIL